MPLIGSTRFVRIITYGEDDGQEVWGLIDSNENSIHPIWARNMRAMWDEYGYEQAGITDEEINTITPAEDVATPDEAWTALALYRLVGPDEFVNQINKEREDEAVETVY